MNGKRQVEFPNTAVLWLVNSVGALFVVVVFMFLVMTAIAQQEVITRIKEQQLALGYSSALAINQEARTKRAELSAIDREQRMLTRQLRNDQVLVRQSERNFEDAWHDLLPLLERVRRSSGCEIALPEDSSFNGRAAALTDFRQCEAGGPSSSLPRAVAAAKPAADAFTEAAKDYRQKLGALAMTKEKLETVKEQAQLNALSPEQQKISASFSDMDVLLSGWMLLGGLLVPLPPAMLQILLTFFSGLFGAVLITFVLLVYPKNVVDVTASKETWSRVFLGGLIALCVYIVLLGGSTVLGSASGISAAGTNYMAFCGIGVLAGMLSDRVAFWLSERADSFFKRQQQHSRTGDRK